MARRGLMLCLAAGVLLIGGIVGAAADERGASLAATCAACHRLDGRDTGIPSITGWAPDRLAGMLKSFRSDEGSNHIMHAVSLSLSSSDVEAIALYLATLRREIKQR